jgi:signal transduction histidine kinase
MPFPRDHTHPLALRATSPEGEAVADGRAAPGGTVESAEERLASAEQTLRDISHALAHDLRTSLRHVSSYAQLMAEPAHANDAQHVARLSHKVLDASRHLLQLMESVSALARLQAADLKPETVDTVSLLRALIRESDARAQGPRVAVVLAQPLPPVWADAALLRRVWQELLDNAWRHAGSHPQPRVEVCYEPVPGGHAFFVRDNGQGFEPQKAAELFGLFRREQGAPAPGLGLGLAMVRRIVECHGGRVWATASPGEGARFGFSLPQPPG